MRRALNDAARWAAVLPRAYLVNVALYAFAVLGLAVVTLEVRRGDPAPEDLQAFSAPAVATTVALPPPTRAVEAEPEAEPDAGPAPEPDPSAEGQPAAATEAASEVTRPSAPPSRAAPASPPPTPAPRPAVTPAVPPDPTPEPELVLPTPRASTPGTVPPLEPVVIEPVKPVVPAMPEIPVIRHPPPLNLPQ